MPVVSARATASFAGRQLRAAVSNGVKTSCQQKLLWCPGGTTPRLNPAHLNGTIPG
jgi:hypothetical protein